MRGLIFLLVAALFATACSSGVRGSGTTKTESRTVAAFSSVKLGGAYELHVTAGAPTQAVTIETDDNLLPLITTTVDAGVLTVETTQQVRPSHHLVVTIAVPALEKLGISGAVTGDLKGLKGDKFSLESSGAGNISCAGDVKVVRFDLSGAGSIRARDLHAETVDVTMSGAGSAEVFASKALHAVVSGAGSVRYGGKPAEVKPEVSGVGSVTPL